MKPLRDRLKPKSQARRKAEKSTPLVAVCLIGYAEAVPRTFGDNLGAWPVRIAATKNPVAIIKRADLEQPLHKIEVLELVWTESDRHAARLKARIDEALLGNSKESRLRHGWRDIEMDPAIVWGVLLADAIARIRRTEKFHILDEAERQRRINAQVVRGR